MPFDKILEVSDRAVDLTRLNAGAPALDSHSVWSSHSQVAVVERAWIDGKEGKATIRFPRQGLDQAAALIDRDRVVGVSSADNSRESIEQRANAFAGAFLLPEAGLEEELRQLGKGQPARTDQIVFDVVTAGSIQGQLRPAPRSQTIGFQDVAFIAHRFGASYHTMPPARIRSSATRHPRRGRRLAKAAASALKRSRPPF